MNAWLFPSGDSHVFVVIHCSHLTTERTHQVYPSCNMNLFEDSCGWVSNQAWNSLQALIVPCSESDDIQDETEGFLPFLFFHEILFQFFSSCTMNIVVHKPAAYQSASPLLLRLDHHLRPFIRGILASYHRQAAFLIPVLDQREEHRGP